jgi:hypothetical protein
MVAVVMIRREGQWDDRGIVKSGQMRKVLFDRPENIVGGYGGLRRTRVQVRFSRRW